MRTRGIVLCVALACLGLASAGQLETPVTGDVIRGTDVGHYTGTFKLGKCLNVDNTIHCTGSLTGGKVTWRGKGKPEDIPDQTIGSAPSRKLLQPLTAIPLTGLTGGAGGACDILHLTLGPLDLNLLGLVIHLNTVKLDITAQPGPGNLLGNLLCDVVHLLDGNTGLNALLGALNNVVINLLGGGGLGR